MSEENQKYTIKLDKDSVRELAEMQGRVNRSLYLTKIVYYKLFSFVMLFNCIHVLILPMFNHTHIYYYISLALGAVSYLLYCMFRDNENASLDVFVDYAFEDMEKDIFNMTVDLEIDEMTGEGNED